MIREEKGRPLGRDHVNGIEGFWSYAKNWLYPYRGVPSQYFQRCNWPKFVLFQPPPAGPQTPAFQTSEDHFYQGTTAHLSPESLGIPFFDSSLHSSNVLPYLAIAEFC